MCGIVGYVGNKSALEPVLDGLRALEYRGYDSAGIALINSNGPLLVKQVGGIDILSEELKQAKPKKASVAIGHTRWATHGSPNATNAHPHFNKDQTIFVVHNGIIENYQEIRSRLKKSGYEFVSETDTEVIPHLIDYYLHHGNSQGSQVPEVQGAREEGKGVVHKSTASVHRSAQHSDLGASTGSVSSSARKQDGTMSFLEAFEAALKDLSGAYAISALYTHEPEKLYVARLSSPLVIGVGTHENFLASDATAIMEHTKKVIYLNDYEVAEITQDDVKLHDIQKAVAIQRAAEELDYDQEKAALGDFPHFMLKEIFEAPQTIQSATRGRVRTDTHRIMLGGLDDVARQLQYIDRIVIVACGTSYYAGLVGEYLIEELAGIPVEVQLASEFKYRNEPFSRSTVLLAISQSGETADTIAAIKKVEQYGVLRLGIVNAIGSTIARITDAGVYCHAGPEQSVASTKAFIAQVTVLTEIALYLSAGRTPLYKPMLDALTTLPDKAKEVLESAGDIEKVAKKYVGERDFLYLGRNYAYPCALEGALKLKEISYIHAEGYAAGEMKHGPLAMIDESFPTFAVATNSPLLEKTVSNIEEIRARKGPVVAIATKGNKTIEKLAQDVLYIPDAPEQLQPLLIAIVMQLFAYYIAVEKGLNVDRPRNLAKSVTVE